MNCAAFGATEATAVASTNTKTGNSAVASNCGSWRPRSARIHNSAFSDGDQRQVEAVDHRDHAIEPIAAVEAVGHRQDDDREQKKQIEEHHAAPGFRRHRKPPVMAEPEQAGDDEADRQRDDRLRIDANQVDPGRRLLEAAGFRQIIGEQRHGNAEDGVAQHLQPAHFEKIGLRQWGPLSHQSVVAFASLRLCRTRFDLTVSRGWPRVARQGEAWCGRPGSNRHSPFEPRDFLTSYGFRRLARVQMRTGPFVVWTIPSPLVHSRL